MTDTITLPREVVQEALEALEWSWGGEPIGTMERKAITALRTHLAAEQPKPSSNFDNQGAVLLLQSKSAEIERLNADDEALRRENERLREALEKIADSSMSMYHSAAHMAVTLQTRAREALRREET